MNIRKIIQEEMMIGSTQTFLDRVIERLTRGEKMEKVDELEVNGIKYVPKNSQVYIQPTGDAKIVVLQRGWVMVGKLERNGSECKLYNASVIRSWGTTKGLGEIAKNGPTDKTILDRCYGLVEFDYLTVVASVSVEESKWAQYL